MHVPQDLMWRRILKTFWISEWTKQGPTRPAKKNKKQKTVSREMKPWWQSIHQETRWQSIRWGQRGEASASRGHHMHNGTQATTTTKHPPGPTRQSIRGQRASRARWNPSDNDDKTSARANVAKHPWIEASRTRWSPSDNYGNTGHPN